MGLPTNFLLLSVLLTLLQKSEVYLVCITLQTCEFGNFKEERQSVKIEPSFFMRGKKKSCTSKNRQSEAWYFFITFCNALGLEINPESVH